jgi:hypothetical protein
MFSQIYYLIRSRVDGSYLVAHLNPPSDRRDAPPDAGYLLLFSEHFDALSYLNTHASDLANRFGVESISGSQIEPLMKRWGFLGMGVVKDPLLPKIEFLHLSR